MDLISYEFKVGDSVQVTDLLMNRQASYESEAGPTYGHLGYDHIWGRERIGIIDSIENTTYTRAKNRNLKKDIGVVFPPCGSFARCRYSFSEDEIELDPVTVTRLRIDEEIAEIYERYWIEDII